MHRNMLPQTGNTANFQKELKLHRQANIEWTGLNTGGWGGSTRKTSASTLKAVELKNSQTGMFYFKKVDDERNRNTGRTK